MANHTRRWTSNDIEKLQRLAGKRPLAEIAAELGRTRGSLAVKAHELKVSLKVVEGRPRDDNPAPANSTGINVN